MHEVTFSDIYYLSSWKGTTLLESTFPFITVQYVFRSIIAAYTNSTILHISYSVKVINDVRL